MKTLWRSLSWLTGPSLAGPLVAKAANGPLNAAMVGVSDAKEIWLAVAAAVLVCLGFIYLWREWAGIAIMAAAFLLMGSFMPSRRSSSTFGQAIYGGTVIGIVCAAGWLMLA